MRCAEHLPVAASKLAEHPEGDCRHGVVGVVQRRPQRLHQLCTNRLGGGNKTQQTTNNKQETNKTRNNKNKWNNKQMEQQTKTDETNKNKRNNKQKRRNNKQKQINK